MSKLFEKYQEIYRDIDKINKEYLSLQQQAKEEQATTTSDISKEKRELEKKLENEKACMAKVKAFLEIARTHTLTHVEATVSKPYDSGTLSRLAVQIDSGNANDPFATKLYTEASAQLKYLQDTINAATRETNIRIEKLSGFVDILGPLLESNKYICEDRFKKYLLSPSFGSLLSLISKDKEVFGGTKENSIMSLEQRGTISIGTIECSLPIPQGMEATFKSEVRNMCNAGGSTIAIPASLEFNKGFVIRF